ncbi:trehalose utilization-domain-containing protein [Immersiella caudata]|uniref:Trehalose utilization-domain-containing protein n=1 Tax=Immersiella caudata TaxID=314043 RepID=A0AA39WFP5_9PEZI|nr:trehalose utilization-domain-containing protein [Immersiella caudata]
MASQSQDPPASFEVLLFSRTLAYRHDSIPAGIKGTLPAITTLSATSQSSAQPFTVTPSEDPTLFSPTTLSRFAVIILLQCSGEFLNPSQLSALQYFVRSGGGVVAIHCASFAMESSPWYGNLIGAVFESHPPPSTQKMLVADEFHPIIKDSLGKNPGMKKKVSQGEREHEWEWEWKDEWYRFKGGNDEVLERLKKEGGRPLLTGGDLGRGNLLAWCREFEGGRSFYTSLGHFDEAYEDEGLMSQVLGGILWAAGRTHADREFSAWSSLAADERFPSHVLETNPPDTPWHELSASRQIQWTAQHPDSKWGWVVYKTTYRDQALNRNWETFKETLNATTRRDIASSDAPDIADKLDWVFVEDPELEGASLGELKRRFREFVRRELGKEEGTLEVLDWGSRYTHFIVVDQEALWSMMDADDLYKGHVRIVRGWADADPVGELEGVDEFGERLWDDEDWMKIHAMMLSLEFYNELENGENWWVWYRAPPAVLGSW